jgi:hypothetical protein
MVQPLFDAAPAFTVGPAPGGGAVAKPFDYCFPPKSEKQINFVNRMVTYNFSKPFGFVFKPIA